VGIRLRPPPGLKALPNDYPPGVTGGQTLCNQAVAQYTAYRATLLYFIHVSHKVMRHMSKNLVEVLARVRANLPKFTGKTADMRAYVRSN
jgi:hypothetical protein